MRLRNTCPIGCAKKTAENAIYNDNPRIFILLFREWFIVILDEADEEFVADLLPVLMERSGVIYGIPEYKHDVER